LAFFGLCSPTFFDPFPTVLRFAHCTHQGWISSHTHSQVHTEPPSLTSHAAWLAPFVGASHLRVCDHLHHGEAAVEELQRLRAAAADVDRQPAPHPCHPQRLGKQPLTTHEHALNQFSHPQCLGEQKALTKPVAHSILYQVYE